MKSCKNFLAKRAISIVATATNMAASSEPSVVCVSPTLKIGQLSMLFSVSNAQNLPLSEYPFAGIP